MRTTWCARGLLAFVCVATSACLIDLEGLDASTVSITTQDFSMNALLDGDVDAAQAMTYNEYAQVLEAINPDTGELYTPDDFNVISYEDALRNADSLNDLRLQIKLNSQRARNTDLAAGTEHFAIV